MPSRLRALAWAVFTLPLCCLVAPGAAAQGFSALVSPPRFEDRAQAGETYRNVVEINNVSAESAHFTVQTADWTFNPDATVAFDDALATGSCRPWVGIEAPEITVPANGKRRYRFEVQVPPDAPAGECRFALMIEGDAEPAPGSVAIPVSGRIGVIVYLAIGDAAARLELAGSRVDTVDGRQVPVLLVRNGGNAHGRLAGFVDATDAGGRRYALAPSTFPILPGETRAIALAPEADSDDSAPPVLAYPLRVEGRLEWGDGRLDIDTTFEK